MNGQPVLADEHAQWLGMAGAVLLHLADDVSLWKDYRDLIRRARVLAEAKVASRSAPGTGDRP